MRTVNAPIISVRQNTAAPQISPERSPFLRLRLADTKEQAKQPAARAAPDIAFTVPALISPQAAKNERKTEARASAPTPANIDITAVTRRSRRAADRCDKRI